MKVLYIAAFFWPHLGGIETLSLKFLPAMQKRGHQFEIVTSIAGKTLPTEDSYQGIPIHRAPFLAAISKHQLIKMKHCLHRMAEIKSTFQPDLIHIQMSAPISYYHIKTLSACSAPTLLSLHTCFGNFDGNENTVLGQTLRTAQWTTMVSQAVMDDAIKIHPPLAKCSSLVYNGIDFPDSVPSPLDFSRTHILGLGRMIRAKGFDILIDAFALLHKKFPNAHLTLAGDGIDRAALEAQTKKLGLKDTVEFTGQISPQQVSALINRASIVVIPSRFSDPLPTVALEAGFFGRPVVAASKGGLKEIIIHEETGVLVEPEKAQALFNAICALLTNPQKAIAMGKAAASRIRSVFGWERYIDAYDNLYCRLGNQDRKNEPA